MTYRAAILAAALLSGMFATFSSSAQAADPVKIRVGWIVMPSNLAPILFAKAGIGRHNDKSYVLDPVYFSSSSAEITALATEQIDIAAMGFSTLPLAIENAGLKDLRLLADEVQDGNGSGFTLQFMVRRDSNINSVTDLKGKVLATIGIGTGAHTGMLATLQKFGLQDKRDYTVIETPFPTMKGMLKDGKADLIAVTTGLCSRPRAQEHCADAVHAKGRHGSFRAVILGRAVRVHREKPRRARRLPRRRGALDALVQGPGQSERGGGDRREGDQSSRRSASRRGCSATIRTSTATPI